MKYHFTKHFYETSHKIPYEVIAGYLVWFYLHLHRSYLVNVDIHETMHGEHKCILFSFNVGALNKQCMWIVLFRLTSPVYQIYT